MQSCCRILPVSGDGRLQLLRSQQHAATAKERDRYCRLAVLAGHREACLMFCFARSDFFEDHQPLKPFKSHGIKVAFYGYYYPSRYADLIDDEQRAFCCSLYQFKEGENHGIEFFKACMSVLNLADAPYHILFMPCSDEFKYARRFKRLDWYITTHRPDLSSGLYDVDVFESRDSLHEAKRRRKPYPRKELPYHGEYRRETDYHRGRRADKRAEYGRLQGGDRKGAAARWVAAIFYGKTVTRPPLLLIKAHVWGGCIVNKIKELTK